METTTNQGKAYLHFKSRYFQVLGQFPKLTQYLIPIVSALVCAPLVEYPLPPRSLGINMLRRKCELISGAQSLAGKILSHKELNRELAATLFSNYGFHQSGLILGERQGWTSHGIKK